MPELNVLIGYTKNRYDDVQLVDTPGVLDRDYEKMNKIEKRAILAINETPALPIVPQPNADILYPTSSKLLEFKNWSVPASIAPLTLL